MLRDIARLISSRGVVVILQPISMLLFARALGPEEQGVLAIILAVSMTGGLVLLLGLDVALNYSMANSPDNRSANLRAALFIYSVSSIICSIVIIGALNIFELFSNELDAYDYWFPYLLTVGIVANGFAALVAGFNSGIGRYDLILHGSIANQMFVVVGSFAAQFPLFPRTAVFGFIVYTAGVTINAIIQATSMLPYMISKLNNESLFKLAASHLKYSLSHYASTIIYALGMRADIIIIGAFIGTTSAGVYSVAKGAAELVNMIPRAIAPLITAKVAENGGMPRFNLLYKIVLISSLVIIVVGVSFIDEVVEIVLSSQYASTGALFNVLVVGAAILGLSFLPAHYLYGLGNTSARLVGALGWIGFASPFFILAMRAKSVEVVAWAVCSGAIGNFLIIMYFYKKSSRSGLGAGK